MEEKELILKACQNDEKAFQELLCTYEGFIYKNISSLNLECGEFKVDTKDLYQEACVALYTACKCYKENMGCKFSTFAYMVIRRKLLTYYKKISRPLKHETRSLDTISDVCFLKMLRNNPNIRYADERKHLAKDLYCVNKFIETLSPTDKKIVSQRANKISCDDIAKSLNINTKALYNRMIKIKNNYLKFKNNINQNDDLDTLVQIQ